jgi:hypothetical protein
MLRGEHRGCWVVVEFRYKWHEYDADKEMLRRSRPLPNGLAHSRRAPHAARGPIAVTTWPDEATRTSNSAYVWTAEAMVEGRAYTAQSRHGPANQLARQLVAAGLPDRPMAPN